MYQFNGITILEGKDFAKDYCKIHTRYFKGPMCQICEIESIKVVAKTKWPPIAK